MSKDINESISDQSISISILRDLISKFVAERNWNQYHTPKSLAVAISIEAAELLEHFLFKPDTHVPENMESFIDEMADVLIYLLSLANTLKLDNFAQVIHRKMEKNQKKYPIEKFAGEKYRKQ